jgi:hypothetical protein
MKLKLFLLSIFALLSLVAYKTYTETKALKSINSYDSCVTAKGSIIQESYPATCVTRLGARFIQPVPSPRPYVFPIENWNTYVNKSWKIFFKHPPTWKLEESNQQIKVYPSGYQPGTFFTITATNLTLTSFLAKNPTGTNCDLQVNESDNQGESKDIKTDYIYNECNGQIYGYYVLYGNDINILIKHSFNDSGSLESVGAVLSTFKFTD